ncbi:substrate-binding domain-containing protein [Lichenibacterium ramalinae]|uniref:Sugar ABC transporter substrate-binding protein n=1 Tax=Lichenibacterium ramalinae TaxID=2316527 RepID=A0A4Q2R8B3_9HYPH|nr:substrate-binding domain-containing protein [Lichenibacterium ramalinae]RYB01690.1 hypothetical protein D3272_24850 [Lichenibacterium ramalinae]
MPRGSFLGASLLALAAGFSTAVSAAQPTFVMVSHSPESDSYWTSVVKGLQQAGKDLGVTVQYRGTDNNLNDPNQQRRNLEAAIAGKPDGLSSPIRRRPPSTRRSRRPPTPASP